MVDEVRQSADAYSEYEEDDDDFGENEIDHEKNKSKAGDFEE